MGEIHVGISAHPVLMHRLIGAPIILTTSALALPITAALFDNATRSSTSAAPLVAGALAVGSTSGATVGALLPGIAGSNASRLHGAGIGAASGAAGTAAAMIGLALLLGS